MKYTIRHVTRFSYESPISESVMEVRMQPRTEGLQRCLQFALTTNPLARVLMYNDHDGNIVHHFNIPAQHPRLTVTAAALVETEPPRPLPHRLGPNGWATLDGMAQSGEYWEMLAPSTFARRTPLLDAFARELGIERGYCPLVMLRRLMSEMYKRFEYSPKTTRVDSPIDEALEKRQGVCQDFTHIFLALARSLGVPARYVSGYLFHASDKDRSSDGATHAWAEALLPEHGWVGFDPTNNLIAEERHVRVAIGRDYADVPPTRGVYSGLSAVRNELAVSVRIGTVASAANNDVVPFTPWMSREAGSTPREEASSQQQQ
jgi:transglutaminase-like putative cysteine protease